MWASIFTDLEPKMAPQIRPAGTDLGKQSRRLDPRVSSRSGPGADLGVTCGRKRSQTTFS